MRLVLASDALRFAVAIRVRVRELGPTIVGDIPDTKERTMARDQAVDETELELDEEGFAGPPTRMQARPNGHQANGGNGRGDEEKDAEIARLKTELAHANAVAATAGLEAPLEAGPDEPVTKGDLKDVIDYVRSEAAARYETVYDGVADRVVQRHLEELGICEDGDEDQCAAAT